MFYICCYKIVKIMINKLKIQKICYDDVTYNDISLNEEWLKRNDFNKISTKQSIQLKKLLPNTACCPAVAQPKFTRLVLSFNSKLINYCFI